MAGFAWPSTGDAMAGGMSAVGRIKEREGGGGVMHPSAQTRPGGRSPLLSAGAGVGFFGLFGLIADVISRTGLPVGT
jgi:hypothetical protein